MKLFADDVKLYCSFDNFSCYLQIVCDKLTEWADKWQMKIAFHKCTVHIGLETIQLRRIKYDLLMCYTIVSGEVSLHFNLLDLSDFTQTTGKKYKLYKHQSNVNAYKYFFL